MQSLFERDFNNLENFSLEDILKKNIQEFAPGMEDSNFVQKLLHGILENQEKLDAVIEKAAPEWPINQIATVDRNILRLGLYELLFGDKKEVPPKVAINEAIELAKNFGGDSSGRFVNGVLGTVYREIYGENEEEQPEKIIEENLAGAIVYRMEKDKILFAFVHDVFGFWTLSKGRLEEGEASEQGAKRELKEEIGLDIEIKQEIGANEYVASDPQRGKIKKKVVYFLASTKDKTIKLKETGGLDDAQWFEMGDLADLKMYDDIKPIIVKAVRLLANIK